jgi:putative transposase
MRHAPLVFTTKREGKELSNEPLQRLETILPDLGAHFDVELGECKGGSDHLHLLVSYPRGSAYPSWSTA